MASFVVDEAASPEKTGFSSIVPRVFYEADEHSTSRANQPKRLLFGNETNSECATRVA